MYHRFPVGVVGLVYRDYLRPYENPLSVAAGEVVTPDPASRARTDLVGWIWAVAQDGRAGWVPESWLVKRSGEWALRRDYTALELSVRRGQQLTLHFAESGFLFASTESGEAGWTPDGVVVALEAASDLPPTL